MGFLLWRKIPATMGSSLATLGKKKNWPENNRKGEKQSGEKKMLRYDSFFLSGSLVINILIYNIQLYNILKYYILDSSHEGIDGSMLLLANRAARQSSQPLVISQSSCKSVAAASRGWTMQPVEASRGIQSGSVRGSQSSQSAEPVGRGSQPRTVEAA